MVGRALQQHLRPPCQETRSSWTCRNERVLRKDSASYCLSCMLEKPCCEDQVCLSYKRVVLSLWDFMQGGTGKIRSSHRDLGVTRVSYFRGHGLEMKTGGLTLVDTKVNWIKSRVASWHALRTSLQRRCQIYQTNFILPHHKLWALVKLHPCV